MCSNSFNSFRTDIYSHFGTNLVFRLYMIIIPHRVYSVKTSGGKKKYVYYRLDNMFMGQKNLSVKKYNCCSLQPYPVIVKSSGFGAT